MIAAGTAASLLKMNNLKLITTHEYARQTCKKSIVVNGNNSERVPNESKGCKNSRGGEKVKAGEDCKKLENSEGAGEI